MTTTGHVRHTGRIEYTHLTPSLEERGSQVVKRAVMVCDASTVTSD